LNPITDKIHGVNTLVDLSYSFRQNKLIR